jgi:hypothetical protein
LPCLWGSWCTAQRLANLAAGAPKDTGSALRAVIRSIAYQKVTTLSAFHTGTRLFGCRKAEAAELTPGATFWGASAPRGASRLHKALPAHAFAALGAAVGAATTVALVFLKVYAPVVAASLAFRAATNFVVSTPDAVPRAALGVPPTFPAKRLQSLAQANPGTEAKAAPRRAPPIHLIALPLERVPVASSLASSSKECSLVSVAIGSLHSPKGGTHQPRLS